MSAGTAIQWATDSWNFLAGCEKVSRGCKFCYAARLAATRLRHTDKYQGLAVQVGGVPRWTREVRLDTNALLLPLKWRKGSEEPRRVFVNSMSDLYHDDVDDDTIRKAFSIMASTPHHRYLILTKRPVRMKQIARSLKVCPTDWFAANDPVADWAREHGLTSVAWLGGADPDIIPNVALGVSVEDQESFRSRVPILQASPAATRFLSVEPLVEDLGSISQALGGLNPIDWIIVGGESGPKKLVAPFDISWAVSLRDQCRGKAAFFYKQPGSVVLYGGKAEVPANWTREAIDSGLCLADLPGEFPLTFRYR